MEKPDFEPEWYIRNNKLMAPRYAKEFKKNRRQLEYVLSRDARIDGGK